MTDRYWVRLKFVTRSRRVWADSFRWDKDWVTFYDSDDAEVARFDRHSVISITPGGK